MSLTRLYPGQLERICRNCGSHFFTWPSEISRSGGNVCSRKCFHQDPTGQTVEERFWSKVQKTETCWIWTAGHKGGKWPYGMFQRSPDTGQEQAHHVSWEITYGPIPKGMNVLHNCDNPPCVRPGHLFLGSFKDNTQDMLKKGRFPLVKVTPQIAQEIRERYRNEHVSQSHLASIYHLGQTTISRIIMAK